MFTLTQLRTFCTVARLNSFTRAAEKLYLTQPAVSAQVAGLEEALKVRLFDRVGKRISLSDSGRVVLTAAEEILQRVASLQQELADLQGLRSGSLSIAASQVPGVYLLPELLARFRSAMPGLDLTVRVEPARRALEMVAQGEVDLGLVGEGTRPDDERLAVRPLLRDRLVLVVPAQHVLAQKAAVQPEILRHMSLLLPSRDSASAESILEQLARNGVRPESVTELGNVGAVKRAVEAGLGIAIVSHLAVEKELEDGRLREVALDGLQLERSIDLCWHHGRPFSKAAEAFVAFLHRDGLPLVPASVSASPQQGI
jgi:DNA-binding transcriptional LysR family regulator